MNQKTKIPLFTGLNLVIGVTGIGASAAVSHADLILDKHVTKPSGANTVLQSDSREFEASFLKVSAGCKVDHAAFDAVEVAVREIPSEVRAIHAKVEEA